VFVLVCLLVKYFSACGIQIKIKEIKMTLDEYIDKAKKELEDFRKMYISNQYTDPENWPLELYEGEWAEQELTYRF
jgi:hypothetical protein